jgi:hypothetical protein
MRPPGNGIGGRPLLPDPPSQLDDPPVELVEVEVAVPGRQEAHGGALLHRQQGHQLEPLDVGGGAEVGDHLGQVLRQGPQPSTTTLTIRARWSRRRMAGTRETQVPARRRVVKVVVRGTALPTAPVDPDPSVGGAAANGRQIRAPGGVRRPVIGGDTV